MLFQTCMSFCYVLLNIKEDILTNVDEQLLIPSNFDSIERNTMEVNGNQKLVLCSAEERNSYMFGTTDGWANDNRILILSIPLKNFIFFLL